MIQLVFDIVHVSISLVTYINTKRAYNFYRFDKGTCR